MNINRLPELRQMMNESCNRKPDLGQKINSENINVYRIRSRQRRMTLYDIHSVERILQHGNVQRHLSAGTCTAY